MSEFGKVAVLMGGPSSESEKTQLPWLRIVGGGGMRSAFRRVRT